MQAFKKHIALFSLIIIALPMILLMWHWGITKWHEHEICERLEQSHLQTIKINEADLVWVKKGKEIIVDGQYFDVKSYTIEQGKFIAEGIFDTVEKDIKAKSKKLAQNQSQQENSIGQFIVEFVALYPPETEYQLRLEFPTYLSHSSLYQNKISTGFSGQLFQPPIL